MIPTTSAETAMAVTATSMYISATNSRLLQQRVIASCAFAMSLALITEVRSVCDQLQHWVCISSHHVTFTYIVLPSIVELPSAGNLQGMSVVIDMGTSMLGL